MHTSSIVQTIDSQSWSVVWIQLTGLYQAMARQGGQAKHSGWLVRAVVWGIQQVQETSHVAHLSCRLLVQGYHLDRKGESEQDWGWQASSSERDGLGCSSKTHLLRLVPSSDLWYVFVMHKYLPAQLIFSTKFTSDWMLLRVTWGAMVKRKDGVDWERNTEHGKPLTILANLFSGLKCPHRALLCIQQS